MFASMSGSIEKLIMMDTSYDMIKLCKDAQQDAKENIETSFVVGDEEFLPMKERFVCRFILFGSCEMRLFGLLKI